MDMITITAKTLDEAITKASIELGTTSDNLDYQVIEKGSTGFFGIFGTKPVVIRVKKKKESSLDDLLDEPKKEKQPGKEEHPKRPAQAEKRESRPAPVKTSVTKTPVNRASAEKTSSVKTPVQKTSVKAAAEKQETVKSETGKKMINVAACEASVRNFLDQMFAAMNMQVDIQISFDESEKELSVDLSGTDMGILIGKRGQTLDSLQYLVSLVVNKDCEGYVRVKLDTENYRARRKETLETLAKNISYKVKRTKKPVSLEPMNPYERRIIHAALQSDRYVVTRSEGEEPFRHIVISLKREQRENKNHQ